VLKLQKYFFSRKRYFQLCWIAYLDNFWMFSNKIGWDGIPRHTNMKIEWAFIIRATRTINPCTSSKWTPQRVHRTRNRARANRFDQAPQSRRDHRSRHQVSIVFRSMMKALISCFQVVELAFVAFCALWSSG